MSLSRLLRIKMAEGPTPVCGREDGNIHSTVPPHPEGCSGSLKIFKL